MSSKHRFRAWDNDAGCFTYSFVEDDNYIWGFQGGKLTAWAIMENPGTIDEPPCPESVELEPPEQSTDLPDKEVFRGDIITGNLFDKRVPITGVVVYDHDHACYGLKNQAGITFLFRIAEIKIIGNVHENPEKEANNASQS